MSCRDSVNDSRNSNSQTGDHRPCDDANNDVHLTPARLAVEWEQAMRSEWSSPSQKILMASASANGAANTQAETTPLSKMASVTPPTPSGESADAPTPLPRPPPPRTQTAGPEAKVTPSNECVCDKFGSSPLAWIRAETFDCCKPRVGAVAITTEIGNIPGTNATLLRKVKEDGGTEQRRERMQNQQQDTPRWGRVDLLSILYPAPRSPPLPWEGES